MRAFCICLVLAGACGGQIDSPGDGGSGNDSGNSGKDGGGSGLCPSAIPFQGASCPKPGLICEIGPSRMWDCNALVTCSSNGWVVPQDSTCGAMPPVGCPPSSAQVPVGSACGASTQCTYPDVLCECNNFGMPSPTNRWQCETPVSGCPRPRPFLGTSCAPEGQTCDYGACTLSSGIAEQCTGGVWVQASTACPL